MGKGNLVKKQAENLGLTKLSPYSFFGRARGLKMKFSKTKPKFVNSITQWLRSADPSTQDGEGMKGPRRLYFYIVCPGIGAYIEVNDLIAGYNANKAKNRVFRMDIYTENADIVRDVCRVINARFDDIGGIIANLDFEKLKKKFKVGRDDVINAWQSFLQ